MSEKLRPVIDTTQEDIDRVNTTIHHMKGKLYILMRNNIVIRHVLGIDNAKYLLFDHHLSSNPDRIKVTIAKRDARKSVHHELTVVGIDFMEDKALASIVAESYSVDIEEYYLISKVKEE